MRLRILLAVALMSFGAPLPVRATDGMEGKAPRSRN